MALDELLLRLLQISAVLHSGAHQCITGHQPWLTCSAPIGSVSWLHFGSEMVLEFRMAELVNSPRLAQHLAVVCVL
jgi:hypothetical protein